MEPSLSGKHVLVVGGSRGIGASTALQCAEAGASVSIIYRSREKEAAEIARETAGVAVRADAASESELDTAVDGLAPLDCLVVSAGIFEGLPLEEMSVEFWDRTMAVNLRSTFLSVRAAVRSMRKHGRGGSIVIITSTAGQRGSAVFSAYATSKAAQIMFMRSMALELAPEKIRVNCVAPAWTETEMADASLTELGRDEVSKQFALGRIGQPTDVANATVFLLSDQASFITGSTITVDGGFDMRG